jgi:hypothetical protein
MMNEQMMLAMDPASIEKSITATLQDVGELYEKPPSEGLKCTNGEAMSFSDGQDYEGLINTAEALECFFIPYFGVKGIREKFWNQELIKLNHITNAIKYLVEGYLDDSTNDGELGLSGTPYIDFKLKGTSKAPTGIARNLDFLDSACFVLSSLLDAKAINSERILMIKEKLLPSATPELIPEHLMIKLNKRITDATRLIQECDLGAGKGWAYTNDSLEKDKQDQLYFTWNALETLEVVQNYLESAPELFPKEALDLLGGEKSALEVTKRKMFEKQSYLAATFLSQDNPRMNICKQRVDFGSDDSIWYYNLFAIISLLITGLEDYKSLNLAFELLLSELKDEKIFNRVTKSEYGRFQIAGFLQNEHEKWWDERAINALLIKALAFYEKKNKKMFEQMLQTLHIDRAEDIFSKYLKNLAEDRLTIARISYNVWDKQKSQYSIYYTERAIEAVTKLYGAHYPNRRVDQYYTQKMSLPSSQTEKAPIPASNINIQIDGNVIHESIIKKTEEVLQSKVKELLNSEFITNAIQEKLNEKMEDGFDLQIRNHLSYILNNYTTASPEKKYKPSIDYLEKFVQEAVERHLLNILANMLNKLASEKGKKIDTKDFADRFRNGLQYLIDWETREKGAIDYGKTFYQMEQQNIVQFVSSENETAKKKK